MSILKRFDARSSKVFQENEINFRALFNSTLDGIVVIDAETMEIVLANKAASEIYGYDSSEEVVGENLLDFLPSDERKRARKIIEEDMFKKDMREINEFQSFTKNGKEIWISAMGARTEYRGRLAGLISFRDITERKRVEEKLRESREQEKFLADVLERSSQPFAVSHPDGRLMTFNTAYCHLLGYSRKELLKLNWSADLTPERWREMEAKVEEEIRRTGQPKRFQKEYIQKDGSRVPVELFSHPIFDSQGNLQYYYSFVTDITERKRAERLLEGLNQAAVAMGKVQTLQEIFTAVAEELKKLGFSCAILLTSENGKALLPNYFSYQPGVIKACQKLVGLEAEDFSIPIEAVDVYSKVIREQKTIFVKDAQEVVRQLLPKPAKRFAGQIAKMLKLSKSIDAPLIAEDEVIGLLTVQSKDLTEDDVPSITAFAHQMAATWRKAQLMQDLRQSLSKRKHAEKELKQSFEKLQRVLEDTVQAMAAIVETRDPYTAGHQRKVAQLASAIAREMGLPDDQTEGIRRAGLIHDIGKINVPAEILSKPSELSDTEMELVKSHAQVGSELLDGAIEFPWPVAEIVLQHHERMDGSGYPRGLSGEEIILGARILAVADVVEAMSSHRPYRPAKSMDKALREIRKNKGTLYDPEVVDACLTLFEEKGFDFEAN